MTTCERCGYNLPASSFALLDYCAVCSKNLCEACMAKGCCGNKPALSGSENDDVEAESQVQG